MLNCWRGFKSKIFEEKKIEKRNWFFFQLDHHLRRMMFHQFLKSQLKILSQRRHDTQHNDIQQNDTQHIELISDIQYNDTKHNDTRYNNIAIMLYVVVLSVAFYLLLCWMSLCWVSLCWVSWRPPSGGGTVVEKFDCWFWHCGFESAPHSAPGQKGGENVMMTLFESSKALFGPKLATSYQKLFYLYDNIISFYKSGS